MRTRPNLIAAFHFSLCIMLGGCATTTAPRGWLPSPSEMQTNTHGAWARVELVMSHSVFQGELIAVYRDTLFIYSDKLISMSRDSIRSVTLTRYQQQHGPLAAWTLIGTLSTISHGWFLAATAPTWIVAGSLAAGSVSREPLVRPRPSEIRPIDTYAFKTLGPYSRFPQGIAEGLDRSVISEDPHRPSR